MMNVFSYLVMSFRKGWIKGQLERGAFDIDSAIDCEIFEIFEALEALKEPDNKSVANVGQIVMYKQDLENLRKRVGAYVDRNLAVLWAVYDMGVKYIECDDYDCSLYINDKPYLLDPAPKFAEVIFSRFDRSITWRDNRVEFVVNNRRY